MLHWSIIPHSPFDFVRNLSYYGQSFVFYLEKAQMVRAGIVLKPLLLSLLIILSLLRLVDFLKMIL